MTMYPAIPLNKVRSGLCGYNMYKINVKGKAFIVSQTRAFSKTREFLIINTVQTNHIYKTNSSKE